MTIAVCKQAYFCRMRHNVVERSRGAFLTAWGKADDLLTVSIA
jgi:hypothetical protein